MVHPTNHHHPFLLFPSLPPPFLLFPSSPSSPSSNLKGKRVFLEALQKNGRGPGHLALGAQLPSGARVGPLPASMFGADCRKANVSAADLPRPDPEQACRCSEDGMSGPTEARVDTKQPGCFPYDAARAGQNFGAGLGEYFVRRWGAREDRVSDFASFWGNVASSAAARDGGQVTICYVAFPEYCPAAVPSREIQGAAWRRC